VQVLLLTTMPYSIYQQPTKQDGSLIMLLKKKKDEPKSETEGTKPTDIESK